MLRLGLIRCLVREASQLSTKQECIKFTNSIHYRCVSKVRESINTNRETTNVNPALPSAGITNQQSEQDFLIRLKNDPDTFGDSKEKDEFDEKDLEDGKHFHPSRKLRTKQYADIIKDLIKKRKIKEAIDVLEVKMIQEDRVKPESYIYNLLLGACGRVGYTKKAFSLYNQMKKRALKVTGGTYTALFNACSNSPWPEDGLTRAHHLRNIMIEKMYEPNDTNYNAMIKAFGRCGDLPTAFSIVDEMSSKNMQIKDDTINFLLQACIQDREAGFRHALLVWRKLVNRNISPSIYTFNLMLRCIRDCEIGNSEVMSETLNNLLNERKFELKAGNNKLLLGSSDTEETKLTLTVPPEPENKLAIDNNLRPNLMAKVPHLGNIISIGEIKKPEDRLLLVGGLNGFVDNMIENHCTPNIKTFTQLLDCLPGSLAAEKELKRIMKKLNVKPDIDFLNMLIKKRSIRFDYEGAKEVLKEIKKLGYRPNLITYGVLALGCKTKNEALELLQEMKEHSYSCLLGVAESGIANESAKNILGACYKQQFFVKAPKNESVKWLFADSVPKIAILRTHLLFGIEFEKTHFRDLNESAKQPSLGALNTEILGAMLHQACYHRNFPYVLEIMELSLREEVKPNQIFMERLADFKKKCKEISNDKGNKLSENISFQKGFRIFQMRYKTWLEEIQVEDPNESHPWTQFRQTTETDTKHYKDKSNRFKARHASRFKVKTSTKRK